MDFDTKEFHWICFTCVYCFNTFLQTLESQANSKIAAVVKEVFWRVGSGIHGNTAFTPQLLLVFVHEIIHDSVPQLSLKAR